MVSSGGIFQNKTSGTLFSSIYKSKACLFPVALYDILNFSKQYSWTSSNEVQSFLWHLRGSSCSQLRFAKPLKKWVSHCILVKMLPASQKIDLELFVPHAGIGDLTLKFLRSVTTG